MSKQATAKFITCYVAIHIKTLDSWPIDHPVPRKTAWDTMQVAVGGLLSHWHLKAISISTNKGALSIYSTGYTRFDYKQIATTFQ